MICFERKSYTTLSSNFSPLTKALSTHINTNNQTMHKQHWLLIQIFLYFIILNTINLTSLNTFDSHCHVWDNKIINIKVAWLNLMTQTTSKNITEKSKIGGFLYFFCYICKFVMEIHYIPRIKVQKETLLIFQWIDVVGGLVVVDSVFIRNRSLKILDKV